MKSALLRVSLMLGSTVMVKIDFLLSRNFVIRLTALNIFAGLLCTILKILRKLKKEVQTSESQGNRD